MKKFIFKLLPALMVMFVAVSANAINVGGKNFTEQLLLTEITAQLLKSKGYEVDSKSGMGSSLVRKAIENKQIDLYWEYTGTTFFYHKMPFKQQSGEEIYQAVKAKDAKENIVWMNKSRANNTYALAVRAEDAKSRGLNTLEDLATKVNAGEGLTFGCNIEFYKRDDGLKPLQEAYGFKFPRSNVKRMDSGLVYKALKEKNVDVGLVFATDGRIPAFNFSVLRDTKGYFPAYAITPVVRKETLDANPKLGALLNELSAVFSDTIMSELNAQVDVDKKSVQEVATNFLKRNGFI